MKKSFEHIFPRAAGVVAIGLCAGGMASDSPLGVLAGFTLIASLVAIYMEDGLPR